MNRRAVATAFLLALLTTLGVSQKPAYGQIISPATNSFQIAGSNQLISWVVGRDTTSIVLLQYSTDAGRTWNHIASTGIAAGSYNWIIPPGTNSYQCKLRILRFDRTRYVTSASTGNFSIASLEWSSRINEVFSHRVIAMTDTSKHHFNRLLFFK